MVSQMLTPKTVSPKIENTHSHASAARSPHVEVTSDYILSLIQDKIPQLTENRNSPYSGVEKRPYKPVLSAQAEVAKAEAPVIKPQKLDLHPTPPRAEDYEAGVKQLAQNLPTLLTLLPKGELRNLVLQAKQENDLLQGATA